MLRPSLLDEPFVICVRMSADSPTGQEREGQEMKRRMKQVSRLGNPLVNRSSTFPDDASANNGYDHTGHREPGTGMRR